MAEGLHLFMRQMLRNPSSVGAIVPSSRALARSMAKGLNANTGQVIEIGPGTGSITRGILEAGVEPENLHLFEMNSVFCENLRATFSGVSVHNQMAQEMTAMGLDNVGAVVSGLPLLNMPASVQFEIVSSVFETLRPDGAMVQFTYGPVPPIAEGVRQDLGLEWIKGPKIWTNLPPARVYVFKKNATP